MYPDPKFNAGGKFDCQKVPIALTPLPAHSSPLGLEYFDRSFLVALHGPLIKRLQRQRGYRVVRISESGTIEDFITGFFEFPKINGRPADILNFGKDAFLLTDDHSGVVYYVYKK